MKAPTVSVSVFRGRILWHFSLSKINISPAAPDLELILFPLWYWPIMNAHTKQQQDKGFETDFIDSQKPDLPICAPFGTKSCASVPLGAFQCNVLCTGPLPLGAFQCTVLCIGPQPIGFYDFCNAICCLSSWNGRLLDRQAQRKTKCFCTQSFYGWEKIKGANVLSQIMQQFNPPSCPKNS